jgi:hypothetical protein
MKYSNGNDIRDDVPGKNNFVWMTSKEVKKHLRITSCELMHKRESALIPFRKNGNAYEYLIDAGERN